MLTRGPAATAFIAGPHRQDASERLGDYFGRDLLGIHMTLFPNLSYLPTNNSLRVWHPKGPGEIEVWAWTLVEVDTPPDVRDALRKSTLRTFGSSGVFEQDDAENWAEVTRSLRGARAGETWFNLSLGGGQDQDPEGRAPGVTDTVLSEAAARSFYGRWARLLEAGPPPAGFAA
jgi:hypothetical protein